MSHAPAASVALGVALFWASLLLYSILLRSRARLAERGEDHGPA